MFYSATLGRLRRSLRFLPALLCAFVWMNFGWSRIGDWHVQYGGYTVGRWGSEFTVRREVLNREGFLIVAPSWWDDDEVRRDAGRDETIRRLGWSVGASARAPAFLRYRLLILDRILREAESRGRHGPGFYAMWEPSGTSPAPLRVVVVSWWWLAAIGTLPVLPQIAVAIGRRFRQRLRCTDGLCLSCGYDLRASPDRCPECGQVPAPASLT